MGAVYQSSTVQWGLWQDPDTCWVMFSLFDSWCGLLSCGACVTVRRCVHTPHMSLTTRGGRLMEIFAVKLLASMTRLVLSVFSCVRRQGLSSTSLWMLSATA